MCNYCSVVHAIIAHETTTLVCASVRVCILMRRQFCDDVTTRHGADEQSNVEDGVQPADLEAVPVNLSQLHFHANVSIAITAKTSIRLQAVNYRQVTNM